MDLVNELAHTEVELVSTLDILGGTSLERRGKGATATYEQPLTLAYARDLTEGDLALLASGVRTPSVRERVDALTHRHHLAARMVADGSKGVDISYATGYAPGTISSLRSDPAFVELVSHYAGLKEAVYLDVHQRLGSLGMAAVDQLQARVEHLERIGEDELADAKVSVQQSMMPTGSLLKIAEMALDRSIAPSRNSGTNVRQPTDIGGGLVVNLNFSEPKRQGNIVDVTPSDSATKPTT